MVSGTDLGRAAFDSYPVLLVVIGRIPFSFKWEEMVIEGGFIKDKKDSRQNFANYSLQAILRVRKKVSTGR